MNIKNRIFDPEKIFIIAEIGSNIGDNVFISAGAFVKDQDIPNNTIVFGKSPNLILKQKPSEYFYESSLFKCHKNKTR